MPALILVLCVLFLACPTRPAQAFAEDLCWRRGQVVNCQPPRADTLRTGPFRRLLITQKSFRTARLHEGRSSLHFDATYFLAVALGFRRDVAYFVAAYDQLADTGQYRPFTLKGERLNLPRWITLDLNGWAREDRRRGGSLYHFMPPTRPSSGVRWSGGVDGLHPNLSDAFGENLLVHLRRMAMEGTPACVAGLTDPSPDGSRALEVRCYQPKDTESGRPTVRGQLPTLSWLPFRVSLTAYGGPQPARFDPRRFDGFQARGPGAVTYELELPRLLAEGSGRLDNQEPVPAELVRLGLYLHALQDRISHAKCGDASPMLGPNKAGELRVRFDRRLCAQDVHMRDHLGEVGVAVLPERTLSALEYTYDELEAFASRYAERNPHWFERVKPGLSRRALIRGDEEGSGPLARALMTENGRERLEALLSALQDAGLPLPPGEARGDLDPPASSF